MVSIWATAWQNQQNDVHPAKTQISLCIHPVWSVFAVRMKKPWVLSFLLSEQRRCDQTGWMPRLIWVFAGHTCHFVGFCHAVAHLHLMQYWTSVENFLYQIWPWLPVIQRRRGWEAWQMEESNNSVDPEEDDKWEEIYHSTAVSTSAANFCHWQTKNLEPQLPVCFLSSFFSLQKKMSKITITYESHHGKCLAWSNFTVTGWQYTLWRIFFQV